MLSLFILRHSNAEEQPPKGEQGDAARRLTAEGSRKAELIGRAIHRLGLAFDFVLSSPAVRARQTAQRVVTELRPTPQVELLEDLRIGGRASAIIARLQRLPARAHAVLLVGHEPDLGHLVSQLCVGDSTLSLQFKKGGLCKLTINRLSMQRCATLEWLLTPRHLRLIAESH